MRGCGAGHFKCRFDKLTLPSGVEGLAPLALIFLAGCAALFGWDIHAPGLLSIHAYPRITPMPNRVALCLDPLLIRYQSKLRGSWSADPQTYHVGEALAPILIEAFQQAFEEFVMLEVEPTAEILKNYGIEYAAVVRIKDFGNRVSWKGQALSLSTETVVLNQNLEPVFHFESEGSSDAEGVFAKKGGPEVNLNAALENNAVSLVQYFQDWIRRR